MSITDDDDPTVSASFGASTYTVSEGSTVTVTVELSVDPERTVTIPLTTTNQGGATTADYSGVPASVTFQSGETSKTFDFEATADSIDDDGESVLLGFGALPTLVNAGTPDETTVSITDDDDPAVSASFGASTYTVSEGSTVTVTVELSVDPERTVTIPLTTTNQGGATTADYSGVPASVTFQSGETSKTFDFEATADSIDDDGESVLLGFGTLPTLVNAGTPDETTVSITDDDPYVDDKLKRPRVLTSRYMWNTDAQIGRLVLIIVPAENQSTENLTYRIEMTAGEEATWGPLEDMDWQVLETAYPGHADPFLCPIVWRLNHRQSCVIYTHGDDNPATNTPYDVRARPEVGDRVGPWKYHALYLYDVGPEVVNDGWAGVDMMTRDYRIEMNEARDRITLEYTKPIRTVNANGYRVHRNPRRSFDSHSEYADYFGFFIKEEDDVDHGLDNGREVGDFDWSANLESYGEKPVRVTRSGRKVTLWLATPLSATDEVEVASVRGAVVGTNGLPTPALNPMGEVKAHGEQPVNSPAKRPPTISGTAQVGGTLTADILGIYDSDGLAQAVFSYQWKANGSDITGATGSTYTVVASDEGKAIRVRLSFTDDAGNEETLTSAAKTINAPQQQAQSLILPGAPAIVHAAAMSVNLIYLAWTTTDPASDRYEVTWSSDGETRHLTLPPEGGDTVYSHKGLTPNTRYEYRVRGVNDDGPGEWSPTVAAITLRLPNIPATGAPTIFGTARVGMTLTADTLEIADENGLSGTKSRFEWQADGFIYQWLADGSEISGADGSSYTPVEADEGKTISVRVSFTDDAGHEETLTSAETSAVMAAREWTENWASGREPTNLRGEATDRGIVMTWDAPQDAADEVTGYQVLRWRPQLDEARGMRVYVDDTGSAATTYTDADIVDGEHHSYQVRAIRGNELSTHSNYLDLRGKAVTVVPNSPATGTPAISGTAQVGETLTADTSGISDEDGLDNVSFSYQWSADDTDISGATGLTYTLVDADEGKAVRVRVTFTDDAGNEETLTSAATDALEARPNRPATGALTITGTARVGELLTADVSSIKDDDGLDKAAFAYQWQADSTDLPGATDSSYTLAASDEGKAISVKVSFTDDASNEETLTSAATAAVEAKPNTPATGQPTISGTAQVGETLTADTSGIADDDGLDNASFSYQWQADNTDLPGATGSTYTVAGADEGKAISVTVSFTDDRGHGEELSSAATTAVGAKPNNPATGAPAITGTAQVGETLTAETSGIADADGLTNASFSYQWLAGGADISGATDSSYTLADADIGKAISVKVSFTDDAGHQETLTSAATAAVEAAPLTPLTALIENAAASHDGESAFTFALRFSEEFGISYKTLRDHAFTVTGGTVKKAQRLEQGSNLGWRITVRPDGNGQVAIVLPETTDCDAQGAICTEDGRKLSHSLELTVGGPGQ